MRQEAIEAGATAAKAAPVAVAGASIAGYSLPDFAALLAIIYTAALLCQLAYRFVLWVRRQWLSWREG